MKDLVKRGLRSPLLRILAIVVLVFMLAFAMTGCRELEKLTKNFIAEGPYHGLAAYKEGTFYIAVRSKNNPENILVWADNLDKSQGRVYFISKQDESLGGTKYVKREGVTVLVGWDEKWGLTSNRMVMLWSWEELSRRQWRKEVGAIVKILLEKPTGPMTVMREIAKERGLIKTEGFIRESSGVLFPI